MTPRPELRVGDKVLGKKWNDVWYSGTVAEVIKAGPGNPEVLRNNLQLIFDFFLDFDICLKHFLSIKEINSS